jgi:uncharacterized protein YjiK
MSQGRPQAHEESTDHPFGSAVKSFLSQKRLSQAKLAQITDLDPAIINKMIKGQRLEGPGGRHRVLTLIKGLHSLGVLAFIDEANFLLSQIPTMGALDARVKEEQVLLNLLKTKETATEPDTSNFNPIKIRLPNDPAPPTIKKIVIKDEETNADNPAIELEMAQPLEITVPVLITSLVEPDIAVIENVREKAKVEIVEAKPPTVKTDAHLELPAFATDLTPDNEALKLKPRFALPSWAAVAVILAFVALIIGTVALGYGRSQSPEQGSTVRNLPNPQTSPIAIALTNVGAVDLIAAIQAHTNRVNAVAFSRDGQLMASGSDDRTVSVSLVKSKERLFKLDAHNDAVTGVAFSPDGKVIASASLDKSVILWNVSNGAIIRKIDKQAGSLSGLTFSPDGKYLAIASYDKTVYVWNLAEERVVRKLEGHNATVSCVAFSSDGKYLASGSFDYSVIVWNTENWSQVQRLEGHTGAISGIAFMPDTTNLASASYDSTVKLWKADDGSLLRTIEHPGSVNGVAFNPQATILATVGGTPRQPILWLRRVRDGATLLELKTETVDSARGVVFSPLGDLIAIPFDDQTIKMWGISLRYLSNERYEILR